MAQSDSVVGARGLPGRLSAARELLGDSVAEVGVNGAACCIGASNLVLGFLPRGQSQLGSGESGTWTPKGGERYWRGHRRAVNDTGEDIEGRSLPVDDGAATRARSLRAVRARELEPKRELCLGGYTGRRLPKRPTRREASVQRREAAIQTLEAGAEECTVKNIAILSSWVKSKHATQLEVPYHGRAAQVSLEDQLPLTHPRTGLRWIP